MRCERRFNRFPKPGPQARRSPVLSVRCSRTAQVRALVPFGEAKAEHAYCEQCANERAADVLRNRGKHVELLPLER